VVWLQADPAELARRLQADQSAGLARPSLTSAGLIAEIEQLCNARWALYHEVADAAVDTAGKTPAEAAELILSLWPR
jgi:shikimate kinase